ncbi:MAG TPA: (2Fe-2S)-binding protein [Gemmatimonadaceae bacterium]|jgi:aerobic-type carbon monoxide dehydrogenase small subunit (CoxS/CutS family)|nr:(2Fe-2S)-binding protein [Gemmatimonadaceae bacterium]
MRLTVNGSTHDVDAPDHETLLTTLRERLHLTGTKLVCGRGECGACTVLIDGASAYACLSLTAACDGRAITTIEGLSGDTLHPVQRAFIEHDALQCGYCTPGQILAAVALLAKTPHPSADDVRRGMSGNLCRCGAYPKIARAVLAAAGEMANG